VKMAGTARAVTTSMRWLALAWIVVAGCTPCEGERTIAEGYVGASQLEPELAAHPTFRWVDG
jgi:hypothetical protein